MTTIKATGRRILLHRVPDDPVRERIAGWLREHRGSSLAVAAAELGIDPQAAIAAMGVGFIDSDWSPDGDGFSSFTLTPVPDGERACWEDECTHGPGYNPTEE